MNNPLFLSTAIPAKLISAILAFVVGATSLLLMGMYGFGMVDPYKEKVLSRLGNPIQGHAIFQINCASCHGAYGDGKVGPSLKAVGSRRSQSALIEQVISGKTPPMPQFQPSPQEMADLLSYLESL